MFGFDSRWSLPLGSCCFGIPVRIHFTFFLLLIVQTLAAIPGGKWLALLWFIVLGPVLLTTILIHELGHSLAARSVGGSAEGILLWPLGGLAFIAHNASPKADIWVAAAGPLTHIPQIIVWVMGSLAATHSAYGRAFVTTRIPYPEPKYLGVAVCSLAITMNLVVFLFNLLIPAYPLDGGRILVDSLLACKVAPPTAAKVTLGVAVPIALGILIYGAVTIQVTTILIAAFIMFANWQLFDSLRKGQLAAHPLFTYASAQQAAAAGAGFGGAPGGSGAAGAAAMGAGYPGQYAAPAPGYPAPGYPAPAGQPYSAPPPVYPPGPGKH